MSKHKQPGGIWTAQYAHCAVQLIEGLNYITALLSSKPY